MSHFVLAPSLLAADFASLGDEVRAAEAAGADWIHLDVMDGHFVPNLTIGPDIARAVSRATTLPCDVHLMVEQPERYYEAFLAAGAAALGVHVEACRHLHRSLQEIRTLGARACVALNPATPAAAIEPVLDMVDQVLVMSVNPGFGGQSFISTVLPKIAQLRSWVADRGLGIDIAVDGGVDLANVANIAAHGANAFVMGSAFFGESDYKHFAQRVRAALRPYES